MKHKIVSLAVAGTTMLGGLTLPAALASRTTSTEIATPVAALANTVQAKPSTHQVYVDGQKVNVAAYVIEGNNYFKLRDIAAVLDGTSKQFDVRWDGVNKAIGLLSSSPYTKDGSELQPISSGVMTATVSTATVMKDASEMHYAGYNINSNNYYKLRDIAESFDFGIKWDGANRRMDILTNASYEAETQPAKPETKPVSEETKEVLGNPEYSYKPGYMDVAWLKQNVLTKDDITEDMLKNWALAMIDDINGKRQEIGMPALIIDKNLIDLAEYWAKHLPMDFRLASWSDIQEYANNQGIDESILDGNQKVVYVEFIYPCTKNPVEETVNTTLSTEDLAYVSLKDTSLTRIGIGFAAGENGTIYCTQTYGF